MYISETTIRVRYAETDRMGYVYYGNYTQYFEVGRVEALSQLGSSYKDMEDNGVMLPVYTCNIKYHKPAYDDLYYKNDHKKYQLLALRLIMKFIIRK